MVRALHDHLPALGYEIVDSLASDPDIVFLMDPRPEYPGCVGIAEAANYRDARPAARIVLRINECDARKGTEGVDEMLFLARKRADSVVFVSEWLRSHLYSEWYGNPLGTFSKNESVIRNGVNGEHFAPQDPSERPRLMLNSSIQPIPIVAHHWSDNPLKGADVYRWIDEVFIPRNPRSGFTFTYIGRLGFKLKNSRHLDPMFGAELGRELSKGTVYVSGSRFDPGPNHVLEALACGLMTLVHVDGGGAVEFAGRSHAFSDFDQLERMLHTCQMLKKNSAISLSSWRDSVLEYGKVFDALLGARDGTA